MSKEQLLQALAEAFEGLIKTATEAARRGGTGQGDTWGPREIVAHLAGWEVMATVRVPKIAAGMPPLEEPDRARQAVMNDAINATIVTMIGDQSLDTVCGLLRQAYQRDIDILRQLDERFFQPGEYVYERTRSVIEHCQEHMEALVPGHP
ncbi:MAG TPA: ClbS/DfsB family four-helix bundle protein [Ktedonobacteraceae bacterium]|nr:ClbS/DfsB family four-helix bundle protein [Ktedonobacteraceae bacterium]